MERMIATQRRGAWGKTAESIGRNQMPREVHAGREFVWI